MPTDSAHAKFLYTIIKQLDLKSIDWNSVASQLDITNGHAARMRYSRFKQHMEGYVPPPRRPRNPPSSTPGSSYRVKKSTKGEKPGLEKSEMMERGVKRSLTEERVKNEDAATEDSRSVRVKQESGTNRPASAVGGYTGPTYENPFPPPPPPPPPYPHAEPVTYGSPYHHFVPLNYMGQQLGMETGNNMMSPYPPPASAYEMPPRDGRLEYGPYQHRPYPSEQQPLSATEDTNAKYIKNEPIWCE
ncbi:MAG: hypothetical protein M1817_003697 [Caeruleum heppii]|nr:MAG: hypothetical protein M1817_003697 [Caeruleum heppii]